MFEVQALSDESWGKLVARTLAFYADTLFNPTWGEQLRLAPNRVLSVAMLFHGLTEQQARSAWQPFLAWLSERPEDYRLKADPAIIAMPGRRFWDPSFLKQLPGIVVQDDRSDAPPSNVFWAANSGEAGQVLNAYQSAWIPGDLLDPARQASLVDALVAGAATWPLTLHTNKGLAGVGACPVVVADDGDQSGDARSVRSAGMRRGRSSRLAWHPRARTGHCAGKARRSPCRAGHGTHPAPGPECRRLRIRSRLLRRGLARSILGLQLRSAPSRQATLRSRGPVRRTQHRRKCVATGGACCVMSRGPVQRTQHCRTRVAIGACCVMSYRELGSPGVILKLRSWHSWLLPITGVLPYGQ
jgi:hypothetical protein